jgi:hypothetical protein
MRSTTVGVVHVSLWTELADEPDVLMLARELAALAAGRESPVAVLLVVAAGTALSTQAARARAASVVSALGARLGAIAIVIEGTGFMSAAVRAMFTGIALAARTSTSWNVFSTPAPAATWLSAQLRAKNGSPADVPRIAEAVERLRSLPSTATRA